MAMTGPEIKAALGHGTLTRIANQHRRSLSHVSRVVNCTRTMRRDEVVENAVARRLGKERFEVFPPLPELVGAA